MTWPCVDGHSMRGGSSPAVCVCVCTCVEGMGNSKVLYVKITVNCLQWK